MEIYHQQLVGLQQTEFLDPNIGNPILSPEETTTYLVEINNSEGCTITDTLLVEVPIVEATFDTVINPGCEGH